MQADPRLGVDAYFWVKPPGESDGAGDPSAAGDVTFDPGCSPDGEAATSAMRDSPAAGEWFHAFLLELVRNAHPPLVER